MRVAPFITYNTSEALQIWQRRYMRPGLERKWVGINNTGKRQLAISARILPSSIPKGSEEELLNLYGNKRQNGVSLQNLLKVSTGETLVNFTVGDGSFSSIPREQQAAIVMQIGCFLHRELPVRYAHRVLEINKDELLMRSSSIQMMQRSYKTTFSEFLNTPTPNTPERQILFDDLAERKMQRHSFTLMCLARGAYELRQILQKEGHTEEQLSDVNTAFDEIYHSRTALRLLIGHYMAMRAQIDKPSDGKMVGFLNLQCSTKDMILRAAEHASAISEMTYGASPKVEIAGRTDLTFPYIQSHLKFMLFELLKNSMRATVETHGIHNMPPIRVVIADGEDNEDVVIKVSDEGGGVKRSDMVRIWSCLFSTGSPSVIETLMQNPPKNLRHYPWRRSETNADFLSPESTAPMAGLGYGLPLSRNYARFFGGDLVIESMEGYGTDTYLYLPRLSKETKTIL